MKYSLRILVKEYWVFSRNSLLKYAKSIKIHIGDFMWTILNVYNKLEHIESEGNMQKNNEIKQTEETDMADRIKKYLAYIDKLLEEDSKETNWKEEQKKHLVQIAFFAHERIIHLLVTITFAILTVMAFFYTMSNFSIPLLLLIVALLCLMIPYIKHYYLLENSVQKMYEQYDKMQERVGTGFQS